MIVITPENTAIGEIGIINQMFEAGLGLLHLRKPNASCNDMKHYLLQIDKRFTSRIALHQHHSLAQNFGIKRLHFKDGEYSMIQEANTKMICSTSTHSMEVFDQLPVNFQYAFLSPVYPSISKADYNPKMDMIKVLSERKNFNTRLVALGGVDEYNIPDLLKAGYDDVAILGTIWNNSNPFKRFMQCSNYAR